MSGRTSTCLSSPRVRCASASVGDGTAGCEAHYPRSCLTTTVPAWRGVDYTQVACCLRCCLLHWVRRLGLDANYEHWRRRGVNFFVHNGAGGQRKPGAPPPPQPMPIDFMLPARFALGRFAHFLAIEKRDLDGLN